MERKKFLKQNSQNKWQKRGLEDNYFKLPFSQNILPKILRIFAKNVECAQDLVFYNYILKCFVLIDLKIGDLTHQDLGQMQMYVHYYERELMNEGDNPPIGIVLCADKSESVVKYTLPENETQIFASKYKLYLPSEEELSQELQREYRALEYDKEKSK